MRQETVSVNGITAVVRTRSRRTAITEAQYSQALRLAHPEIADFETALLAVNTPNLPINQKGEAARPLTEPEQKALEGYISHTARSRSQHQLGDAYADAMNGVVPLLARIVTIGGAKFHVNGDGSIPDEGVVAALEDWLNDDGDKEGFWSVLSETIAKLDTPLTPVSQQPPETLTPEQQDSPLFEPLESVGSSG